MENNTLKKNGIYIKKGAKTQTKIYYSMGYKLITYLRQPLHINFKSEMVNDINQLHCGGWLILPGIDLSEKALLERVLSGKKPMAILHGKSNEDYDKMLLSVDQNKFYVAKNIKYEGRILVARKGKIKDLFDLDTLDKDYLDSGIVSNLKSRMGNKTLESYFYDWDAQDKDSKITYPETGLILGYPIENTISLLLGGIR